MSGESDPTSPEPRAPAASAPLPGGSGDTEAPPAGSVSGGRRHRHPILRVLRFISGLLLQVLLLAVLLILLVLGTQTGLRLAIDVGEELAPGMLSVGQVDGRLLGALHLRDVEVHVPNLDLKLGSVDLDWSPLGALAGTLKIRELAVRDIDVVAAPAEEDKPAQPIALPEVVLPLKVEIDEALVERLRVFEPGTDAPSFVLDRASLGARAGGSSVELTHLEVKLPEPDLSAEARGQVTLTDDYPLGLDLGWTLVLGPDARLTGEGRVGGDLDRLAIEHRVEGAADVRLDAHVQQVLTRPSWDGEIRINRVDLPALAPGAPALDLTANLATAGDLDAATVTGTLAAKAPDLPDFGDLRANLDLLWKDQALAIRALELDESVSGARLDVTGGLDLKPQVPSFEVSGDWSSLRWPLSGELLAEAPEGSLTASGDLEAYTYGLKARIQGPDIPETQLDLAGKGDQDSTRIESLDVATLGGTIKTVGDVAWAPKPSWKLEVRGQDLDPQAIVPGLEDRIGFALDSAGDLDAYGYDLALTTRGPGLPPARLALGGKGDLTGTTIDLLRLDALEGRVEGEARVGWDPEVTWDARLMARDLNPGAYAADWPGRIGGQVLTQGSIKPEGPELSARLEAIQGQLRGYPVAARGEVRMAGREIQVESFEASSGPSVARVNGRVELPDPESDGAGTLDLDFDLSSPDLASLLPEGRGSLSAKGSLGGSLKEPAVRLDLSATDAEVAGQGIGSLKGSADVSLTPEGRFEIQLDGSNLIAGGMTFDTVSVRGDGSMPRHRLAVSLAGQPLSAELAADGSLGQDGAYQGSLGQLTMSYGEFGTWRLQKSTPVSVAGERISAGPLCLRNDQGSGGCLGFEQSAAGEWAADVDLDPLGFDLIAGLLPQTMTGEGAARVKGRFEAKGPLLTGGAVAAIPEGRIRVSLGQNQEQVLDFGGTELRLDAGAQALTARLDVPLKDLGQIDGRVELPGWRLDDPARPGQPLRGGLEARLAGLERISDLVPDVTNVTGSIEADLSLAGTIGSPQVRGQAKARDLGAEVPLIGLTATGFELAATADTDRLDIQGQGDIGGGRLELSGGFRFGPSGLAGQLRAGGERLKVADTDEYQVILTPSIDVTLAPTGVQVRGDVTIPEASIRPRAIPAGTVTPSADVVMMDQAKEEQPLPLDIDLRVVMGEEVTIDAFGLRGRLDGTLRVFQEPGRDMLGDGQLGISEGLYRITAGLGISAEIGAPLTIEQGRLIWAKTPIANPGLLIEAQREGGDTTAGVRVLGTIRNPKLAFFSESDPGMTQAEITTYLLTGIPPRSDGSDVDRSLAVGTYVAPKLYMEYESALGDQQDKVKLRYDLNRHFELQTETGETQGADIFYKFEN